MESQFFCQATASTAIDIGRFSSRAAVKWPAQPFDDAGFIRSWTAPNVFSSNARSDGIALFELLGLLALTCCLNGLKLRLWT